MAISQVSFLIDLTYNSIIAQQGYEVKLAQGPVRRLANIAALCYTPVTLSKGDNTMPEDTVPEVYRGSLHIESTFHDYVLIGRSVATGEYVELGHIGDGVDGLPEVRRDAPVLAEAYGFTIADKQFRHPRRQTALQRTRRSSAYLGAYYLRSRELKEVQRGN
jgi:hypothetical protein